MCVRLNENMTALTERYLTTPRSDIPPKILVLILDRQAFRNTEEMIQTTIRFGHFAEECN